MKQISPALKALVIGEKGPLVDGEVERVKDYARELAIKLKRTRASVILFEKG